MLFTIKKGSHYSNHFLHKIFSFLNIKDRLSYFVQFNKNCQYIDNTNDKYDVNKLFGFSIGWHHNNSHRFGWNYYDNQIHIYAYSYVDKQRIIQEIGTINVDEEYRFLIRVKNNRCLFTIIDSNYQIKQQIIPFNTKKKIGYYLWPYFGGNKKAPQKISINLWKID